MLHLLHWRKSLCFTGIPLHIISGILNSWIYKLIFGKTFYQIKLKYVAQSKQRHLQRQFHRKNITKTNLLTVPKFVPTFFDFVKCFFFWIGSQWLSLGNLHAVIKCYTKRGQNYKILRSREYRTLFTVSFLQLLKELSVNFQDSWISWILYIFHSNAHFLSKNITLKSFWRPLWEQELG